MDSIVAINKSLTDRFRSHYPNPNSIPFDERLTVIANPQEEQLLKDKAAKMDISADVLREVQLYQTALENTKRAIVQLKKDNCSRLLRPNDFYAQMFKDDQHMSQIKSRFEREKKKLEKVEQKKEKAIQKKFTKQKRHQRNVESALEKKKNLDAIEKYKQNLKAGGTKTLNDFYKENKKVRSAVSVHKISKPRNKKNNQKSNKRSGKKR